MGIYVYYKTHHWAWASLLPALGILWLVFYPYYSGWRYKNHFRKHVNENYQNRINKDIELVIDENGLLLKDPGAETKIKASEINELIETPLHYFIKLNTNVSVIVPKLAVRKVEAFKEKLGKLGAVYTDQLNWAWK